jgi:glyceraldehyde 3-phosphate dehydrogenase
MAKIGINGFGRIGRLILRLGLKQENFDVVAVNDLSGAKSAAYLFKYDSVHGTYAGKVEAKEDAIIVDGKEIKVISEKDPEKISWKKYGVEIVAECTGAFRKKKDAEKHIRGGAKRVVLSAPAKGEEAVPTFVYGVNCNNAKESGEIISCASCTTNCLAPVAMVLQKEFGIKNGFMTTIHAYTGDQRILDGSHKDLHRARAAALSIIPTSTGAAKAIGLVLPELDGKLDGIAMRVPVADGSIVDLTIELEKEASEEQINAVMKKAAESYLKGIMQYNEDPIVSIDVVGNLHASIFDSTQTKAKGNLVKVCAWYDNEAGYAKQMVNLISKISK